MSLRTFQNIHKIDDYIPSIRHENVFLTCSHPKMRYHVSYALWFTSSISPMISSVLLWANVISLYTKYNPYKIWTILLCLSFCLDWTLWLSVTIHQVQFFMFNVFCSISSFYILNKLVSLIDLTQLFLSEDLSKFSLIPHSLFLVII